MNRSRNKLRAWLLACGVLWALPLVGTVRHSCWNSADSACCTVCQPGQSLLATVARGNQPDTKSPSKKADWSKEAKTALEELLEGNRRFVAGKPKHKHTSLEWRMQIAKDQKPFATILGCADSRVSPEMIFDQGLGDLFVVRVAGNVVDTDVSGSLEYAGRHLGTRLFVVLGHEQCGAVTAVVAASGESTDPPGLMKLLARVRPALKNVDPKLPTEKRIAAAVEANVRWSMNRLATAPEHKSALADGKVNLIGAIYELETGKVRVLE